MSNKSQNDDLITEVLNQDPKYVETRNQKEVDFKQRYTLNSSFGFTFNRFHWFKFRYVIPSLILFTILGVSAYTIQSSRNSFKSSSNLISNSSSVVITKENSPSSGGLVAKAPAPFLPFPGSKELSDNSNMNNKIQNPPTLGSKVTTNGDSIAEAPKSSENYANSTTVNENQNLKTTVKSQDGSTVTFSYDSSKNTIDYSGVVFGADACTFYDRSEFGKEDKLFVLKYKLKRTGDICAQVIKEIPVKGSLIYKLESEEIKNFDKLFVVQKI